MGYTIETLTSLRKAHQKTYLNEQLEERILDATTYKNGTTLSYSVGLQYKGTLEADVLDEIKDEQLAKGWDSVTIEESAGCWLTVTFSKEV